MNVHLDLAQDLDSILHCIQTASLKIYEILKQNLGEYTHSTNATGDVQLQADIQSDLILQESFRNLTIIAQICSEEQSEAIPICSDGIYSVAYDPLDGSSLMGANLSVGSIFGIYRGDFLPQNLVASAYVIYGMVVGVGFASCLQEGVQYFVYDGAQFSLQRVLKLTKQGKINATGGTQKNWSAAHRKKMESFFEMGYRLRYSGGMVPDLHHILIKGGGIFSYPATSDAPKGKLRMLFEVFPFAFIFECAGGAAVCLSEGFKPLLTLTPQGIHDTTSCCFGSVIEVSQMCEN